MKISTTRRKTKAAQAFNWQNFFSGLWAPLLFLFCFGLYLRSLCPIFMDDDSPETIAAGVRLGLAHPPSYAWTTLWVRLVSFLPLGNTAFAVNAGSAFLAALTAVLFAYNILLVLDHFLKPSKTLLQEPFKIACAVLGALLLAFSHTYWEKALGAKGGIYLWQALLAQVIFYFFLRFETDPGKPASSRWFYLVLLFFGMGFTNHWQTQVIFMPIFLPLLIGSKITLKKYIFALSSFVLGISVLLFLPLRSNLHPGWNLGAPDHLSLFFDSFFRRYVDDREKGLLGLFFQIFQGRADWTQFFHLGRRIMDLQGPALGGHLVKDMTWSGLLLAVLGLFVPWTTTGKKVLLFVLLPFVFLLSIFFTSIWVSTSVPFGWLLDNYLLPTNWMVAFLAALGLYQLALLAPARWASLTPLFVLPLLLSLGLGNFPHLDQQHQTLRYDYGVNILKSAPRNTVFFAEADEDYFPVYYLRAVEHKRLDIVLIPAFTLFETWGVEQVERLHPELGLTASTQDFPDKFARLVYSLSQIIAKNKDHVPCAYSYFNGAFHHYYIPYHPSDLLLRSGVLYEIGSPALLSTLHLPAQGLRFRNSEDPSNGHESLQGIVQLYRTLGFSAP